MDVTSPRERRGHSYVIVGGIGKVTHDLCPLLNAGWAAIDEEPQRGADSSGDGEGDEQPAVIRLPPSRLSVGSFVGGAVGIRLRSQRWCRLRRG